MTPNECAQLVNELGTIKAAAEQAGMALADYYFRVRDLRMAAEAYDLFLENYPRSKDVNKARLRLIYSYLADYRGPRYDSTGLQEARLRLEDLRANEPGLAQRIGARCAAGQPDDGEQNQQAHEGEAFRAAATFERKPGFQNIALHFEIVSVRGMRRASLGKFQ